MAKPMISSQRRGPSRLPIYYFAFSHLALVLAFLCLATFSQSAMGFFYHPWMMVPVHLVTLGWLSASILGALYMIAPMALRSRLVEGRLDKAALVAYICGLGGMLAHFWIDSYGGMLWSALGVIFAIVVVGSRTIKAVARSPIALGVKLHLSLAFINFLGVALLGVVMAFAKIGWLPLSALLLGSPLSKVYAHFHLAAIGWILMVICGVAYRLLPMLIPTAVPRGAGPIASALLMQAGTLGVLCSFLFERPWLKVSGLLILAGLGAFAASVAWMLRNRRPPAKGLRRPDYGLMHVVQAMLYLLLTVGLGLSFVFLPWPELELLAWIPIYAILGLLGCAASMILGIGSRLFPLYAWLLAFAEAGFEPPPISPHDLSLRGLQAAVLGLWTLGVPTLALGFFWQRPAVVVGGAVLLGLAGLGSAGNFRHVLRQARASVRGEGDAMSARVSGPPSVP